MKKSNQTATRSQQPNSLGRFDRNNFIANETLYQQDAQRGSRNFGVYKFEDAFIKVVKRVRGFTQEQVQVLQDRVQDLPNIYAPTEVFDLPQSGKHNRQGIIMKLAEGTNGEDLTEEEIESIPDEHWASFEATIRTLSERGIQTDLTKRGNFIYDKTRGFLFIDIEKASTNTEPTGKFFKIEGREMYYPFERFRVLPRVYSSAKKLFTDIPRQLSSVEE